jgi:NAD(P)-dependent dehydrogenase (short-subunit alcohol dehydrogenase family)
MRAAIILRVTVNQLDFAGRTAVVTGGAQGIGAAIVERLRSSGGRVQIWDLDGTPRVDVSDPTSVDEALKHALKELGKIDAGEQRRHRRPERSTVETRSRNGSGWRVNLTSQFLCAAPWRPTWSTRATAGS